MKISEGSYSLGLSKSLAITVFTLSPFAANAADTASVAAPTTASAPASAPKARNALVAAEVVPVADSLVTYVSIPEARVASSRDGNTLTLAANLNDNRTKKGSVVYLGSNGSFCIYNPQAQPGTNPWGALQSDDLPGGWTLSSVPSVLSVSLNGLSEVCGGRPGVVVDNGQIFVAHGSTVGAVVNDGTYGVVERFSGNTRLLDASAPVVPGEIATTPTPIKFVKAGKVTAVIGAKYQVTLADGNVGEWTDQPGDIPAGAVVNMQITTSAEVGANNAGHLFTQENGEAETKNTFQVSTDLTTLYYEEDLSLWLDGSTAANRQAIDFPLKIDVPGVTNIKLTNTKTGELIPFNGVIPSPKGKLAIHYKLSYNFNGTVKEVSFDMMPALNILNKEIVIAPGEKIKRLSLNISNVMSQCSALSHVATTLGIGSDHIISSKDGVIVKLESYDSATGAITVSVDTSAATITGNQDIIVSTRNISANTTHTSKVTIKNIGAR